MTEDPLISVITPFYNVAGYLAEAVESVLQQSYTRWELLLVDDGSTDGSTDIALGYAGAHPGRIRYLQHPGKVNRGTSPSRNLGILHARGTYLALLDADDYWLPGKLTFQVSIARRQPRASMICGATLYWYSWADKNKEDIITRVGGPQDKLIRPPAAALALYPLGKGAAPCLCSILLKKETVLRYHGFEESFTGLYQFYEDQAFLIKMYLHEPVFISSGAMDFYRQRKDSNMSLGEDPAKYREVRQYFLQWLGNYMTREQVAAPAVRRRIKKALRQHNPTLLRRVGSKIRQMRAG